jgi:hypothetical protein
MTGTNKETIPKNTDNRIIIVVNEERVLLNLNLFKRSVMGLPTKETTAAIKR